MPRRATDSQVDLDDLLVRTTLSVDEVASVLSISRGLAYKLASSGQLPGVLHLGRRLRISAPALRRFLQDYSPSDDAVPLDAIP